MKSDLEYSKKELEIINHDNLRFIKDYRLIHTYIEEDRPYAPELDSAFSHLDIWAQPYLSRMTYETIKAKGIDIIQNDSLKRSINEVYNLYLQSLDEDITKWEWSFNQNTTQRMMVGHIRRNINADLARPNDFERLREDEEFMNFLSILIPIRESNLDYSRKAIIAIEKLIVDIEKELQFRGSD